MASFLQGNAADCSVHRVVWLGMLAALYKSYDERPQSSMRQRSRRGCDMSSSKVLTVYTGTSEEFPSLHFVCPICPISGALRVHSHLQLLQSLRDLHAATAWRFMGCSCPHSASAASSRVKAVRPAQLYFWAHAPVSAVRRSSWLHILKHPSLASHSSQRLHVLLFELSACAGLIHHSHAQLPGRLCRPMRMLLPAA